MANRRGAEDARNHLPELLESAERGSSTIITKRGRAVAVLAPADAVQSLERQPSLLTLAGSGLGLWGADSRCGRSVARRMGPLTLEGLREGALLLLDNAPIIYSRTTRGLRRVSAPFSRPTQRVAYGLP